MRDLYEMEVVTISGDIPSYSVGASRQCASPLLDLYTNPQASSRSLLGQLGINLSLFLTSIGYTIQNATSHLGGLGPQEEHARKKQQA
jgi:hypothetical protein